MNNLSKPFWSDVEMKVNRTGPLFCALILTFVVFAGSSKEPNPSSKASSVNKQFIVHLEP